jgi:hypothetical protein
MIDMLITVHAGALFSVIVGLSFGGLVVGLVIGKSLEK